MIGKKNLDVNKTMLLLIQSGEMKLLPCQLEPTQVISIKVTPEKEILLLPKFAI